MESFRRMWLLSRKRKNVNDELEMDFFKRKKKRSNEDDEFLAGLVATIPLVMSKERKRKSHNKNRDQEKCWWTNGYERWDEEEFVKRMRVRKETFNIILDEIKEKLQLLPTNFNPHPTTPDRQLALTIYRLAHGCSYTTLGDLFGLSEPSVCNFFILFLFFISKIDKFNLLVY